MVGTTSPTANRAIGSQVFPRAAVASCVDGHRSIHKKAQRGFTLIELMIVVAIIGILAMLAIFGVKRYLKTAKTAEATNNIGAIQKNATEAMTREKMSGIYTAPGTTNSINYGFCVSEAASVPAAVPKGTKYSSGAGDWATGKGAGVGGIDTGFYCLKFDVAMPQYYAYRYTATGTGITAGDTADIYANGDLDGNGVTSEFKMEGQIATQAGRQSLVWAPLPLATNPEE
jgi:type IV pilus assembly protein PilA